MKDFEGDVGGFAMHDCFEGDIVSGNNESDITKCRLQDDNITFHENIILIGNNAHRRLRGIINDVYIFGS